jgi:hypothetical protein
MSPKIPTRTEAEDLIGDLHQLLIRVNRNPERKDEFIRDFKGSDSYADWMEDVPKEG